MTDLDRPLTVREFREFRAELEERFATKDNLKAFATKDDLKAFATKDDLKAFATKDDLKAFATKEKLKALHEEMAAGFADMRAYVEFSTNELKRHFDIVTESFRDQFANLYDWTLATTTALGNRTSALEVGQRTLEMRVTRLESRRKKPH